MLKVRLQLSDNDKPAEDLHGLPNSCLWKENSRSLGVFGSLPGQERTLEEASPGIL
jgi:hypothetical protein